MHKLVAYLGAGLGLWALSIGPYLSLASEIAIAIAFVASWFVEGERVRDPRWSRGWTIAVIAFFGLQILRGFGEASILTLALELTAVLQISRLFNRRGAAEHQQIGALALLMLIAATVLTTEVTYALAFGGFVIVAPWMLALGHLRAEIEASHTEGEAPDDVAIARVLASKQLVGPRFLAGTAALAVPLFLMTGLLFVAFPRVGLGMFSFGREIGQPVSGFGANVELGDFGLIRTDPTVVLRVTPPDLPESPPDLVSIRMRGTSFDHYDGRRWTRSRDLAVENVGRNGNYYAVPLRVPNHRDEEWEIVLDPLEEPVIFLPPHTVGLSIPPRVVGSMDVGREVTLAPGLDLRYGDADGLGLRYRAYTGQEPFIERAPDPEMVQRYLQVPEGHERVAALAREWTEGATDDRERVRRILRHLRDSGDYTYSLEMPALHGRQPLEVFLFEARRGHCEYYSTATAVMLRSLGIPARNATGFLGGRFNGFGRYYALSQGDAHSWVEAWIDGVGWVTIDPTPPSRDEIHPEPGWLGGLREVLDAIRTRWASDVVSYDLRSQLRLFWQLREWLRGEGDEDEVTPESPDAPNAQSSDSSAPWPWIVAGLVLLGLGSLVVRRLRRRREAGPALDPSAARAVELLRLLDQTLKAMGWPRPPDRTASEHLERLAEAGFGEIGVIRQVVDRYLAVRYGGETLDPAELERLRRAIRSLAGRRDLFAPTG
ncbi:MAG: DUF3488 domain-containing protein [Myxococcales bacterium]|nr:DUF3488 domain-containing protein [Myxococcales bacterium]